ncbi:MAG: bifunctional phosphopantothenoylcysteine decarboxylase/phosphopantothenate--cysteine ligase CoaBC [Verrucomicrobiota bacterium]
MNILVTAGPTREPIDPVRFLSNRSSGKMGFALAEAANQAGHEVILISGPVHLEAAEGIHRINVESARDMYEAVSKQIDSADAAVFCAAVADYGSGEIAPEKIKKTGETLTITLTRNADILGSARDAFHFDGVLVGFAAETQNVLAHAREKLEKKQCDIMVANDVSKSGIGFNHDENEVTLIFADGHERGLPRNSKLDIAREIVREIERLARLRIA